MALLSSDDRDFYAGAGMTWLLSALVAIEILGGWICGHRLRSKLFHFMVLVYGMRLGRHALKLRAFLANIPESRRFRCPAAVGVAGECVLMEGAFVQDLLQVATSSFHLMTVLVVLVISKKSRPRRPRVPGWEGVGTTCFEILLFVLCILTCAYSIPVMVLDYVRGCYSESRVGVKIGSTPIELAVSISHMHCFCRMSIVIGWNNLLARFIDRNT